MRVSCLNWLKLTIDCVPDVRYLHLDQVVYNFECGPTYTLLNLTHLSVSNPRTSRPRGVGVLGSAGAPILSHLAMHNTCEKSVSAFSVNASHPPLGPIVSQLKVVTILEHDRWTAHTLGNVGPQMASLEVLVIGQSALHVFGYGGGALILRKLERSLQTLDLVQMPVGTCWVRDMCSHFEQRRACVSGLRMLRLPRMRDARLCEGEEVDDVMTALAGLAATAEARGVIVEWV